MMSQRKVIIFAKRIPVYIPVLLFTLAALLPFYVMFIMGTYKTEELFSGFKFLPGNYLMENFKTMSSQNYLLIYKNSIVISVISCVAGLTTSALAGYGLAKFQFKGREFFYKVVIATIMLPYQIYLVGYLMEMKWMHLNTTLAPMFIPFFSIPFGVFWMTQYIKSAVPDAILDSARIDGCNECHLFLGIVFPLIKPASITLTLLIFLWSWNAFLIPLIFITDPQRYTIPLAVSVLGAVHRTDSAAKMLALSIATLPTLVFFGIFSKYLVKGVAIGAIKE